MGARRCGRRPQARDAGGEPLVRVGKGVAGGDAGHKEDQLAADGAAFGRAMACSSVPVRLRSGNGPPLGIEDGRAILLVERAGRQALEQVEHRFARAAQSHTAR